jgi:hypothetical protein
MPREFWQSVWMDSRKVPAKKALKIFNKTLKAAHAPYKATQAKPAHEGQWTKDGYVVPFKVKVVRTRASGALD